MMTLESCYINALWAHERGNRTEAEIFVIRFSIELRRWLKRFGLRLRLTLKYYWSLWREIRALFVGVQS